ncbi:MAG: AAA family ATPase [Candidatus Bathyarchaeota archaeon]|nr:MAG: AAA family ATPase [Candidatus Bathyarchaeota archaeon]
MTERVPTGIEGFDDLIEKGLPIEGVFLVAGSPGAGKTTFAAQFIYEGATRFAEKGIYVCFAENRDSLLRNLDRFGWNFNKLEIEGYISILDLFTTKEPGIQSNLNLILEKINEVGAKRLVIDSFTAFSMALTEPADVRFLIHLLYRFLKKIGCTTVMISDMPWGSQRIGLGVEEFIVDGIILMQTKFDDEGMLRRSLRIIKMRSTHHSKQTYEYDITDNGIQFFPSDNKKF